LLAIRASRHASRLLEHALKHVLSALERRSKAIVTDAGRLGKKFQVPLVAV
jgi:hypothetical protein